MPPETRPAHPTGTFTTQRTDNWWVQPTGIFLLLSAFVAYGFIRVFSSPDISHFVADNAAAGYHYLAPFGTPDLTGYVPAALIGIPVVGVFLTYPGFLILPFPAGFRFTCYYYRKAYYRAFAARPAACSTEALRGVDYKGEKRLMIFQNLHRYFLYFAILITAFLAYDAVRSIWTPHGVYLGLGSIIMLANVVLLFAYTFGCHSFRHLIGGRLDCFSCDAVSMGRKSMWDGVTRLNASHGTYAMLSLVSVAVTDTYIWWLTRHPDLTHLWGVVPV